MHSPNRLFSFAIMLFILLGIIFLNGCDPDAPTVIIITATPPDDVVVIVPGNPAQQPTVMLPDTAIPPTATITPRPLPTIPLSPVPVVPNLQPSPDATRAAPDYPTQHSVQSGDTLSAIANRYNVSLDALLRLNELANPNILTIGQIIQLPEPPSQQTPGFKILPDSRLVRAPGSAQFDIEAFINQMPGYIRVATDDVDTRLANGATLTQTLSAAQVVARVAQEYSVDPRVLLILLEYRANWLSQFNLPETSKMYPLISEADSLGRDRSGLYRQLAWAADRLNQGYYGWKYRNLNVLQFTDDTRVAIDPGLNAGTVALQYFLGLNKAYWQWLPDVDFEGFYQRYYQYFGDPFQDAIEPLVPDNLQQPALQLPFEPNLIWRYTGGPHGGWGSGSAWSALDFAPPDERPSGSGLCYTSTSWVTALIDGLIVRSDDGAVVIDVDGDGDETTGWSIFYLHLADDNRVTTGQRVQAGDRIGRPSCAGGFSTATHLHIGRRYNGEWLPADCTDCPPGQNPPPFMMDGWQAVGIEGQEYQGFLVQGANRVVAEQGRQTTINEISQSETSQNISTNGATS